MKQTGKIEVFYQEMQPIKKMHYASPQLAELSMRSLIKSGGLITAPIEANGYYNTIPFS